MTPFKRGARIVDREKFDAALREFRQHHEAAERRELIVVAVMVGCVLVAAVVVAICAC